jgi:glucose dehydrogenase
MMKGRRRDHVPLVSVSPPFSWSGWAVAALLALAFAASAPAQEWPSYGGDSGGQRFSGAMQITPQNVGRLAPAWIFHTGEQRPPGRKGLSFEDTPILANGRLLVCTRPIGCSR